MEKSSLSRGEISRGLRAFIISSSLWGAWGATVGIGASVFTGYALSLGATESTIALFTSVAYLTSLFQLLSPALGGRVANKKRLIVVVGSFEILFRGLLVAVPLLFVSSLWLKAFLAFLSIGLVCGYMVAPFYGGWIASTIPETIRARFTSQQTIASSLVGMITGFLVGRFIDSFAEADKHTGFLFVFAIGTLVGWLGYLMLCRAPFPRSEQQASDRKHLSLLLQPFADGRFRRAVIFYAAWNFALGLGGPFYSVFMLKQLQLSYTTIALFNAIFTVSTIVGFHAWAGLVDRFGSKPVLQILLAPSVLTPILWVFNRPDAYFLLPVALALNGIIFAGIAVSVPPLLYSLLPEGDRKPVYLASWSTSVNLVYALGPLIGSFLVRLLQDVEFELFQTPIKNLQILFLISALARLVPVFLLRSVAESRAVSSRHLLAQIFRGNIVSYAFNVMVYATASEEDRRARAAMALGRSGNPMAVEQLIQALRDASPTVRRHAALALGEARSQEAVASLIEELSDEESDIRSEAAEALGRIGHPRSIDPLVKALDDEDDRTRISAIRSLGEIGGKEIQELLFLRAIGDFDRLTFPTLVDVLSRMEDKRIVKPALKHLSQFRSPTIRLQLLNSVCRSLGADGQFYRLLSYEDTRRAAVLDRLLRRTASIIGRSKVLDQNTRRDIGHQFKVLMLGYGSEDRTEMANAAQTIVDLVRDNHPSSQYSAYETLSIYVVIAAVNDSIQSDAHDDLPVAQEIFLSVCLARIAALFKSMST